MIGILRWTGLWLLLATHVQAKPNVVVLSSDDLGYQDIGCYSGPVKTPGALPTGRRGRPFHRFLFRSRSLLALARNPADRTTFYPRWRLQLDRQQKPPRASVAARNHARRSLENGWLCHCAFREMASRPAESHQHETDADGAWLRLLVCHGKQCSAQPPESRQLYSQR